MPGQLLKLSLDRGRLLDALHAAAHRLLVLRLKGDLDTPEGLRAWNDLIAAHDAVVDFGKAGDER